MDGLIVEVDLIERVDLMQGRPDVEKAFPVESSEQNITVDKFLLEVFSICVQLVLNDAWLFIYPVSRIS